VQVVAFAVCLLLAKKVWPRHKDPWMLADLLTSLVVFPLLAATAIRCVLNLRHTVTSRWTGVTPETRFFLLLYIARCLVHMPVQAMEDMSKQLFVFMTVHHVISITCFGSGLMTGRMHFWGCFDGCCEMSTVFLNIMYCGKDFTVQDRRLQDLFPKFFAMNGLCLWLSFLIFRIMLFPAWLYYWHRDVVTHPELTWNQGSTIERYLYPTVTVLLLVLSITWFVSVTKGAKKACCVLLGLEVEEQEEAVTSDQGHEGAAYHTLDDKSPEHPFASPGRG
jgi:hypothetical protein